MGTGDTDLYIWGPALHRAVVQGLGRVPWGQSVSPTQTNICTGRLTELIGVVKDLLRPFINPGRSRRDAFVPARQIAIRSYVPNQLPSHSFAHHFQDATALLHAARKLYKLGSCQKHQARTQTLETKHYNKVKRVLQFRVGGKVLHSTKIGGLKTPMFRKLLPKWEGYKTVN